MFTASTAGSGSGLIPNFGPAEPGASDRAIRISGESLGRLAEKIVRGFVYLQEGHLITNTHRIEWFLLPEGSGAKDLMRSASIHSVGPGIVVHYVHTSEDTVAAVLRIEIWNRLKLYATVNPRDGAAG
jgi:hypothetical protein